MLQTEDSSDNLMLYSPTNSPSTCSISSQKSQHPLSSLANLYGIHSSPPTPLVYSLSKQKENVGPRSKSQRNGMYSYKGSGIKAKKTSINIMYTESIPNVFDFSSPSIKEAKDIEDTEFDASFLTEKVKTGEEIEKNSFYKSLYESVQDGQLPSALTIPTLEKVIQLSESLNRSHNQMQECHNALKASLNRQNEIKTYYQSLLKNIESRKESEELLLKARIKELEKENMELKQIGNGGILSSKRKNKEPLMEGRKAISHVTEKVSDDLNQMRASLFEMKKDICSFIPFQLDINHIASEIQKIVDANFAYDPKKENNKLLEKLEYIKTKYQNELALRKQLQNELIEEKGNIRVFCRIRPFLNNEKVDTVLEVSGDAVIIQQKFGKIREFEFDKVYAMDSTQEKVFADVKPLLASVFDGYNVCILAYGQTGSGKTYTMEGGIENPGVIPRALSELFSIAKQKQDLFTIKLTLSMVEIYNNDIRDLLISPRQSGSRKIEYSDIGEGGLEIRNVTLVDVTDINEVQKHIKIGSSHRAEGATLMNSNSSRSHSIVTIDIECQQTEKCRQKIGFAMKTSKAKLRLVDLAGSECVGMSGVKGEAQMEASHVNRSLSALGDVMNALSTPNRTHIPYRNSRLTHFLQDSLGGDAKMIIFVNVNPSMKCATETAHSLSFGNRVRLVTRVKAQKHIKS